MHKLQSSLTRVLLLGCGFLGRQIVREARTLGISCCVTTRDPARVSELASLGVDVRVLPELNEQDLRGEIDAGTGIIATFPPDGATDERCAALAERAFAAVYISSTGVYGSLSGRIDDRSVPTPDSPRARARLAAEEHWRAHSATVLRAAAIYGPHSGMHTRLRAGSARIAGDGAGFVSRIHVDDLAALTLASVVQGVRGETYVVADDEPARQGDVVRYLAARLGLPVPACVPLHDAPETLRHNRQVDASGIKGRLSMGFRYPSYREGFEACLAVEEGESAARA